MEASMTQLAYPTDDREQEVNPDLSRFVRVETERVPWSGSPAKGVLRKRLELIGTDAPRLTTLVRFTPASIFPAHVHDGGEELLVLEGTFSDDRGDYPSGTYVRNPPGSRHATSSREGCTLFVKLRQFAPGDEATVVMDTRAASWQRGPGVEMLPLHHHDGEQVSLLRLAPNAVLEATRYEQGAEILVLTGMLIDEHGEHPAGTWLRYPPGSAHTPSSRPGCTLYLKHGHLA
jgi:anti-sigma factor ChrR (cupin superfamily)